MSRRRVLLPLFCLFLLIVTLPSAGQLTAQTDGGAIRIDDDANIVVTLRTAGATQIDPAGFGLTCAQAGSIDFTVRRSGATYIIDPATALAPGDACTVSVFVDEGDGAGAMVLGLSLTVMVAGEAPAVTDTPTGPDETPTPQLITDRGDCTGEVTAIGAVQGSDVFSPLSGDVTIEGIVTGDFEDDDNPDTFDLRGFYIQDAGDGDPATSDGIFIFTNATDSFVNPGDRVQVTGTVSEFPSGGPSETQLRIDDEAAVTLCSQGNPLPAPVEVMLPFADAADRERYEGMYVTFPQTLTVTELFQLGRHGQLTLSSGGRLYQPTHSAEPGAAANAVQAANDLNQIIIDDAYLTQNPDPIIFPAPELAADNTVRGGDTVSGVTGVFSQTRARAQNSGNATIGFRVRLTEPLDFSAANPRPTDLPDVGPARLTVASFNVLNYFNTFRNDATGCYQRGDTAAGFCRGADDVDEFIRQRDKIINAVVALDADVVGLVELENDAGDNQAIADLVEGVNEALGAETYAFVDTGRIGEDAIRVGFIYRPATVTPVGDFAVLDNTDPFNRNTRPPLAQLWQEVGTGEQFYAVVNHFKSKGSCGEAEGGNADLGDGQGCWNQDRSNAAVKLVAWTETDPYFDADPDVLILGDLNAYAQEDPIRLLDAGGFTDLAALYDGELAYSYVFDGQWGYLDYALANRPLLLQVTGFGEFHINADEPTALDYNTNFKSDRHVDLLYDDDFYRASDHDPLIVGLALSE